MDKEIVSLCKNKREQRIKVTTLKTREKYECLMCGNKWEYKFKKDGKEYLIRQSKDFFNEFMKIKGGYDRWVYDVIVNLYNTIIYLEKNNSGK